MLLNWEMGFLDNREFRIMVIFITMFQMANCWHCSLSEFITFVVVHRFMVPSGLCAHNRYQQCICPGILWDCHGSSELARRCNRFAFSHCNITLCKCSYCQATFIRGEEAHQI